MVKHIGSHGTTKTKAQIISKEGFNVSGGQFVAGAYFWLESHLYVDLAIGWYKSRLERYKREESSPECAVIIADLSCDDNELMDLERPDFKERLSRLADAKATRQDNDKEIYALYAYTIKEMERISGISFKLFLLRVPPPNSIHCPRYKVRILGFPTCVIARTNRNILINNVSYHRV